MDSGYGLRDATPERLTSPWIEAYLVAMRQTLYSLQERGSPQRIAQVVGNLGDCYNLEDEEYVDHIRAYHGL